MAEYDVVLLPTFAQVESWRKKEAIDSESGLFSLAVTTFNAWIADLWELYGDGRAIVDSLQRRVIMQATFDRVAAGGAKLDASFPDGGYADLSLSPGLVVLAAKCVREGAGVPAFEQALAQVRTGAACDGFSPRESLLMRCIACYLELLAAAGLVELGHAAAFLSQHSDDAFPASLRVKLAYDQPLTWLQESFFASCPQLEVYWPADESENVSRVHQDNGAELRFGFPSGRYAQPALVADILRETYGSGGWAEDAGEDGPFTTIVTCKDPLKMYKALEQGLAEEGIAACVQARIPFGSTDFGRQFLSLRRVLEEQDWSADDLSDAAQPPFSGFGRSDALLVDKGLRADRALGREESITTLSRASDVFSHLEDLASDPEADILLGVFEKIALKAPERSDAWRQEQLSAASALRSCTAAARRVGAGMEACASALKDVKITISYLGQTSDEDAPISVVVTTQEAAARMGAGTCAQLLACDLTANDYQVSEKDDAAATLFAKFGLLPAETALVRARRLFNALQDLPTTRFVCIRPLNDVDGNPTYPAAVLQELIDAYRGGAQGDEGLDAVYGLPQVLREGVFTRGEEDLFANAAARPARSVQPVGRSVEPSAVGGINSALAPLVALPRRGEGGRVVAGFSPSPSQVEMFLECPYKWFVQNRVRVEELDEGFGALERGSFAHSVLQKFYSEFAQAGHPKVTSGNIEEARALMLELAEQEAAHQREMDPGNGRYVPVTQLEEREVQACIRQLVAYLDFESELLPDFKPAYLEYSIGVEDGISYAGHPFVGTVDRIDVDDAGHAVVIDYKGSAGAAFEIAGKTPDDPGKVQARMYAQVVRKALGLDVVGAVYVTYGKQPNWAGAVDGLVIGASQLPGAKFERNCCRSLDKLEKRSLAHPFADLSFSEMLDATEQLVADAMARMEAGDVDPAPVRSDVCTYCPATSCPKRGE